MNLTSKIIVSALGLLTVLFVHHSQLAQAGWSVNVGLSGSGTVTVKVSNAYGTNTARTPFMAFPSAAINKQSNFVFSVTTNLPPNASSQTYVQVRAFNNYGTSIQSKTGPGDTNDSDAVLQFVIPRSACASADVDVVPLAISSNSITLHYSAKLSDEGSAVLLQVVDATTGQQRYVILATGPSDTTTNTCEGTFTVVGDPEQLLLLVDGNTSTLPFNIACPSDMVIPCGSATPATYDPAPVVTGDTGPFTLTYDLLPNQLAFGVTNTVTATARDTNGCTVKCQFNVYREALGFDGFFSPVGGADATGGTCSVPLRTFKLGNVVPVKFKMICNGEAVTTGVPTITIQRCAGGTVFSGPFQAVNDEWHFNIDSTIIGTTGNNAGNYTIIATLPDGSQHTAVIQYKK
jgi:hypothetical protein